MASAIPRRRRYARNALLMCPMRVVSLPDGNMHDRTTPPNMLLLIVQLTQSRISSLLHDWVTLATPKD